MITEEERILAPASEKPKGRPGGCVLGASARLLPPGNKVTSAPAMALGSCSYP